MILLYFSGTGNTKYIGELFAGKMKCSQYSIEENLDFHSLIQDHKTIAFAYPIYGSRVPRIMREFVKRVSEELKNKQLIIFCTQFLFSGDGARAFMDILSQNFGKVIYAEHFFMPNNINNFALLPVVNGTKNKRYKVKANRKMNRVCSEIRRGIIRKRGFHVGSRILGLSQGLFTPSLERKTSSQWLVNDNCNGCKQCMKCCPMDNLKWEDEKMQHKGNCTLCYRCINLCPKKAITIFTMDKVTKQYKGI